MRLDGCLVEESPHRRWADGQDDAVLYRGTSQIPRTPVGHRDTFFGRRSCGQGNDLMLLVRGKKSPVCLGEGGP